MGGLKFTRKRRRKKFSLNIPASVWKWAAKTVAVCFLAFLSVWYVGRTVSTVGDSMSPVLENGDVALVNRIIYDASAPKRGDVIVFKPKGNQNSHYYMKRVIGLPGETVEIIEGRVYINGKRLKEGYETTEIEDAGLAGRGVTLGEGEFFVLGDNRGGSEDSRSAQVGKVRRSYIYGKAWFCIAPFKHFGFVK